MTKDLEVDYKVGGDHENATVSLASPLHPKSNQDHVFYAKLPHDIGLSCLMDGMGGVPFGDLASRLYGHIVELFLTNYLENNSLPQSGEPYELSDLLQKAMLQGSIGLEVLGDMTQIISDLSIQHEMNAIEIVPRMLEKTKELPWIKDIISFSKGEVALVEDIIKRLNPWMFQFYMRCLDQHLEQEEVDALFMEHPIHPEKFENHSPASLFLLFTAHLSEWGQISRTRSHDILESYSLLLQTKIKPDTTANVAMTFPREGDETLLVIGNAGDSRAFLMDEKIWPANLEQPVKSQIDDDLSIPIPVPIKGDQNISLLKFYKKSNQEFLDSIDSPPSDDEKFFLFSNRHILEHSAKSVLQNNDIGISYERINRNEPHIFIQVSDGVSDNLTTPQIKESIHESIENYGLHAKVIALDLAKKALKASTTDGWFRAKPDDISVIIRCFS